MNPYAPSIYIAGPYERKAELREYAAKITAETRCHITSRWLTDPAWPDEAIDPVAPDVDKSLCKDLAYKDLNDIQASDMFVLFSDGNGRGGRNVEYGFALREQTVYICVVIGSNTTIFHHLATYHFINFTEFIEWLTERIQNESKIG